LVAFEFLDAPIALTRLDRPAVYVQLAREPEGPVCELPLGIGDGLSGGVGSQDRRTLYYATLHGHPIVGGYVGRMREDAEALYRQMPIVGDLLALSDERGPEPAASNRNADAVRD